MMTRIALLGVGLAMLLVTWVIGSEADELRQQARALQKEAAALAENGRKEEAEKREAEARRLLEAAERHEHEQKHPARATHPRRNPQLGMLETHLNDLLAKEREATQAKASEEDLARLKDQVAATRGRIDALREELKRRPDANHPAVPPHDAHLETAVHRIQHLRMAAEHLRAAGAAELSHQVAEQAEQMEREVRRAREHMGRTTDHEGGLPAQIEELRREMHRLRAEVEELRRQVKDR